MQYWLIYTAIFAFIYIQILLCIIVTSNILCMLWKAATNAAYPTYGAAVVIVMAPATTYQTAAPYPSPIAVVAQGRAPAKGDMGSRPIYGILWYW